jgi:hypothetical protein
MNRTWLLIALGFATLLVGGPGYAGSDPATTQGTLPAPVGAPAPDAPLVLSIRSLSVSPMSFTEVGQVERVTAPTGSGTSSWPSAATHIGRGVYISVMPGCIPGVDEPLLPSRRRR